MKQGWQTKTLAEVCEVVNGGTPKTGVKEYWDGDFLWITPAEMGKRENPYASQTERKITDKGLGNSSAKLLPPKSVILSSRAPIGHLVINTEPMATNQGCKGLIPSDSLHYKYLFYYLGSKVEMLNDLGSGATFKELSGSKLKEVPIPIASLPEQQRIVAILDEACAAIAKAKVNAEQNLRNAKELFESYLQSVFENKGEGWEEKILEELSDKKCTLSYGIVQPGDEYPNGLPIIRPTDLTSRFIKIEGLKRIDPKLADGYKRTTLIGDELLLCVRGSTGVVSIATRELNGANVTRGIVPIRFNSEVIDQEFGYYLLISKYIQKQISAKTYGAALMQINIGDLRKIQTPYPPLTEQQTIVQKLDALSTETKKLEKIYQQKINDLEELKKSILQKAFSGELKASKEVAA
jgi:type I restriction enzyme S subunit